MKKSTTKRSLLASVMALALCVIMLVGTTFAWFTDTASTGVNKITAGNLHVEIQDENDKPIANLEWVAKDGRAQDKILWEPGATYTLTPFKIANTGNLALKYKMVVTGLDGDAELLKVIHFTYELNGEALDLDKEGHLAAGASTGMITVSATMDKTAGNEYMDKTLEGIEIKVYATQDTVESDSFGTDYDADAIYPPVTVVTTDAELTEALKQAKETKNMTIMLAKGTYGSIDVPVLKEGETISGLTIVAEEGAEIGAFRIVSPANYLTVDNLTLKNLTFTGEGFLDRTPTDGLSVIGCKFIGSKAQFKTQVEPKKNVLIENCYFDNEGCANTFSSIYFEKGVENLVIKGTTIKNSGFNAISLQSTNADYRSGGVITIENNTMTNIADRVIRMNGIAADAQITIKDNSMTNNSSDWFKASLAESGAKLILNGNTVNGSAVQDTSADLTTAGITF